jgi:hypothetical protein
MIAVSVPMSPRRRLGRQPAACGGPRVGTLAGQLRCRNIWPHCVVTNARLRVGMMAWTFALSCRGHQGFDSPRLAYPKLGSFPPGARRWRALLAVGRSLVHHRPFPGPGRLVSGTRRTRWRRPRRLGLAFGLVLMAAGPAGAQVGFDRPGGDYDSFPAQLGDPASCALRCDRDPRCRTWSFSYPGTVGPNATCRLKNQVPRAVANPCCVAGVKGAGVRTPHKPGLEFSIDRPGGDYRTMDTPSDPAGSPCAAACHADARCRAWTYFRPGYHGPAARCALKEHVTPPRVAPCCISGVIR